MRTTHTHQQVAQQIRVTQQKAALLGQAPAAWAIGAPCQALYSDGKWYDATVKAVTIAGQFVVSYEGYSEAQEVRYTQKHICAIADKMQRVSRWR